MKRRICDICKKPIYDDEELHYRVYLFRPKEDVYNPSHPRKKKKKDICISCWSNVIAVTPGLPSAEPNIIHCGDCKYKDDGIDEEGIPFLKCLNGRSYGGTRINDFCSWGERRTQNEKKTS